MHLCVWVYKTFVSVHVCIIVCVRLSLCVCVSDTQVIGPLLLCRQVASPLPWSQQWCRECHSREELPIWNESRLYSDWWVPSGTTRLCFCVSQRDDGPHSGRGNMAALQISDIQRRIAAPAESLLAYPLCFWPVLVSWIFSLPIAARGSTDFQ